MSLLAASLVLGLVAPGSQLRAVEPLKLGSIQLRQRQVLQTPEYLKLLPSLATLVYQGQTVGTAVLIDQSGLYLASKDSVSSREVEARFSNDQKGHVSVVSEDPWTQLVLLRSDYVPPGAVPIVPAALTPAGTPLIIVVNGGAIPARIASDSRLGLVRPSNRIIPLSEVRLELPDSSLGNAPVFTITGQFVGLISGSLGDGGAPSVPLTGRAMFGAPAPFVTKGQSYQSSSIGNFMGPANLTVGYLPSLDALKMVLDGFSSPSHVVEHPTLGIFCVDGAMGALVKEVVPDSPASKIGIRDGDMITGLGIYLVRNKNEFAKALFKYRVGSRIPIRIDRDGKSLVHETVLGKTSE